MKKLLFLVFMLPSIASADCRGAFCDDPPPLLNSAQQNQQAQTDLLRALTQQVQQENAANTAAGQLLQQERARQLMNPPADGYQATTNAMVNSILDQMSRDQAAGRKTRW